MGLDVLVRLLYLVRLNICLLVSSIVLVHHPVKLEVHFEAKAGNILYQDLHQPEVVRHLVEPD